MNPLFICTKRPSTTEINPPHRIDESGFCMFCFTSERELELAFEDGIEDYSNVEESGPFDLKAGEGNVEKFAKLITENESLRNKLAAIEKMGREPDEPDAVKYLREKFGDGSKGFVRLWDGRAIAIVNLIDTLRDLLRKETVRGDLHVKAFVYEAERADKLQAKLAAIEKMGREPSDAMRDAGNEVILNRSNTLRAWRLMFAKMMEEIK
jgi:hypothetical protein